ncbi:unnamed protein product [Acanthoscelides obtectus]|uniref:Uncharacterized protein n=1 Tax=Acanthoscelides obtectus TaxID=200917 RepID=A0A9P0JY59_ACAOB|nr:unnamed protein product [Acanthoscelides obtectus]CAK1639036.1 hypothetical protein AOBTE_LOCUS10964 [Acanthoscelides obtectus]
MTSTYSEDHSSEDQTVFVNIIKYYPVLLEKSNIPEIKNKRRKAVEEIKEKVLIWQIAHKKCVDYTPTACAEEETITEEASGSAGPVLKATTMKAGPSKEPSKKKENED